MMLEVATLTVRPGHEAAFEQAFEKAQRLLPGQAGYLSHELRRAVGREPLYLLLIEWRAVDDRTLGFGQSPSHARWHELLQAHLAEPPQPAFYRAVSPGPATDGEAAMAGKVRNAGD
ncbi:antibiotic biosynthesis monooxygenase family protein [Aquabacterium sp. OR-4]|uniref:antibiotic biosynthesis monooxygenase family protein n=1 Tax=Aquabacterium sp. OR-4 TaxID=2978127 RepID=UPI0021B1E96A|nr:antibiotic biosynthesis monooxygenase family protein [Aquabacterium sp. OR-4]MDT7836990.1 antibiotic biosynthesis monooxygenase family protein [Aquabacterium sp. OR-4]